MTNAGGGMDPDVQRYAEGQLSTKQSAPGSAYKSGRVYQRSYTPTKLKLRLPLSGPISRMIAAVRNFGDLDPTQR